MPKTKSEPKKLKQANKSPNQKQQPILSAAQRRAKAKRTLTIFGVSVAVILGLVVYFGFGLNTLQERGDMARYLEDKYGEEFIVGKPERKASGLAVEGYLEAEAYPKDNDSLIFLVRSSSGSTSDDYPQEFWSSQERRALKPILERGVDAEFEYDVRLYPLLVQGSISKQTIPAGKVLNVDEALSKYKDILGYDLTIKETLPRQELSDIPTDAQLKRALFVVNAVRHKSDYVQVSYLYQTEGVAEKSNYAIRLDSEHMNAIKTTEDLKTYYKRAESTGR